MVGIARSGIASTCDETGSRGGLEQTAVAMTRRQRHETCWRAAVEDLYEAGQHRLHLIDLLLLARNDLTAKFLDFRILDGRCVYRKPHPF
jgi:hypothetical protein